jgi:RNA polymerase sigma factor (sigma-70 family)
MLFRKNTYTDKQLVAMVQGAEGERNAALHYIYVDSGWRRIAFKVIRSQGGGVQDAEDAIQEAVIVLDDHVRKGKFQGKASLKNFFIGICRGRWYSNRRSVQRLQWAEEPVPAAFADVLEPESLLLENEQKNAIRKLVQRLDERCRELLRLYKLAYSFEEIATALELGSANNARQRTHQCRKKLAAFMDETAFYDEYLNPE